AAEPGRARRLHLPARAADRRNRAVGGRRQVVLRHVGDTLETPELLVLVAGPVVYLLAQNLMRVRIEGGLSSSRTGGIVACLAVGLLGTVASAFVVGLLLTLVLGAVVVRDELHRRARAARIAAAT